MGDNVVVWDLEIVPDLAMLLRGNTDQSETGMPSLQGPPMTLGNMRSLGIRSLAVTCELCHHESIMPADQWPDEVLVSTFRPRMVCTSCGTIGADARPNWREFSAPGR